MAVSSKNSKKRGRALVVFDTVEALETQDAQAERKRRAATAQTRDLQRSKAAQSQTGIYGSLVECRILLQRSMVFVQQQQQQQQQETENAQKTIVAAVDHCSDLLVKLLHARGMLSQQKQVDLDYKALVKSDLQLGEKLQTEYEMHREEWKEVLDRRHKDVRLHSGALTNKTQFRVLDSSFWQQVDAVVQHEQFRQQTDSIAFDDTKVYLQMLKDFVTGTSTQADTGNSAQSAAQQRVINKKSAANSKKAQVDRKASKGRKIRYTDIPKLANFTFPLSRPSSDNTTALDEDAWFRSLFGGIGSQGGR